MKLLIVEDESRTRELLRNYISWEELGIGEVDTARNGKHALEKAMEWRPDIIVCDVRMPKLNGIDFARQYRETAPHCKLIFLSGFSDKEYLKSAINLKALTYLEKPVVLGEVRAAVESAVQLCGEESRKREEEIQLQADIDRSLPFLRQEMVRKLITFPDSSHVEPALRSQDTFLLPPHGPYTVMTANLYWSPADHPEDPTPVHGWMLDEMNRNPELLSLQAIAGFDSSNRLVVIVPGAYRSAYREGRDTIERVVMIVSGIAGNAIELQVGVGEPVETLLGLPSAYKLASLSSSLQYYYNSAAPLFSESLGGHEPLHTNWEEVRRVRDQLRRGEIDNVKETLRQWTIYARTRLDLDILRVKDTYFQFLLVIMEIAVQLGLAELSEDTEKRYMWKEIDRISSLDASERYVLTFLELLSERPEGNSAPGSGKLREIIHYINGHFHNKGFTIKAIADHVQLSETYLCAFFKKQRGQTIKEFITETKMNKAKELLRDSNAKLFEVAVNLGFTDPNYFTTFFKRCEGCTPSEYRERVAK